MPNGEPTDNNIINDGIVGVDGSCKSQVIIRLGTLLTYVTSVKIEMENDHRIGPTGKHIPTCIYDCEASIPVSLYCS